MNTGKTSLFPQLHAQLEAAVEEALASGGWLDAATVLPSALSAADAGVLLAACPSLAGSPVVHCNPLVVFVCFCTVSIRTFELGTSN